MPRTDRAAEWREILIVHAALESGLLAAFKRALSPEEAAGAAGLDGRATRIAAVALRASGHLEDAGEGRYRASERGRAMLVPGPDGGDPAGGLDLEVRSIRSHLELADTLRSGRPCDDVSGGGAADRTRFMRAMREVAARRAPDAVAALGAPSPGARILDVGGAPGTYACAFAGAGWDVTVLDLPETLAIGEPELSAAGVACVAGDARAGLPDGPWDAVYLGNVLHLLAPDAAAAVVASAAAALVPGGILAVQEVLGDLSPQGPRFGVMMLLSTDEGDAYASADYRGWMAAAGSPLDRIVSLDEGWHHLLIGRRSAA